MQRACFERRQVPYYLTASKHVCWRRIPAVVVAPDFPRLYRDRVCYDDVHLGTHGGVCKRGHHNTRFAGLNSDNETLAVDSRYRWVGTGQSELAAIHLQVCSVLIPTSHTDVARKALNDIQGLGIDGQARQRSFWARIHGFGSRRFNSAITTA